MNQHQITSKTKLVGLIGWPVETSLNTVMHNAAFAQLGIDWACVPLPVQPKYLEQALKGLVALNFVGANVIAPHRQALMRYMDKLSQVARITGAVDTIHIQDGKFYGYDTDASGIVSTLKEAGCDPKDMRVAILGAGGPARAAIFSLALAKAACITVLNCTSERAAFLVDDLAPAFPGSRLTFKLLNTENLVTLSSELDLVINTTTLGRRSRRDACPWPADVAIPAKAIFYDLVYNPLKTVFLQRAREAGAKTIDGLGMLIHQGAFAFKRWTGQEAPVEVMRQVCLQELALDDLRLN